ncbi:pentatricopeptide repeat-containing protein At1g43980, mitochondrial [Malania oleifera]|uniref:pentatricopeptide repeat-containing protein At1g43980, mitochondrial n=1 Tax=Malania oleifera TaxID=397392 RepID=UPI0025ADFF53|nr:pentatricopeptide repeat-containing protein At1g43980, mitochondrial [Malania oleifera]
MYSALKKTYGRRTASVSFYSNLMDYCLAQKSLVFLKFIHAQLIKDGFNNHTFLGNRCLDLYTQFGFANDALKVFDEIHNKNSISWNISLKTLLKFGHFKSACNLFDEMPERDVVSWNSMVSGCTSCGFVDHAFELFFKMQDVGIRPTAFTFTILMSISSVYQIKQLHASMIRNCMNFSSVVLGNALIDMYGKFGLLDYALGVFLSMEELDIISWNSLISSCHKSGYEELALNQFFMMRSTGHSPDQFTMSTVIAICSNSRDLDKGMPTFVLCIKMGFLSNTIISSAAIDLFSKCNKLEDSVHLFEELDIWDSIVCNSMISSYARHGCVEDALQLFVLTLREELKPTEFTLSSVLSSASVIHPLEQGCQIHSLVLKHGFESDAIVANSLVDMYAKFGLIDSAMKIFANMVVRDLISWNTMIMGLAFNGRIIEALDTFKELLEEGPPPDRITLTGVLMACNSGHLVEEGIRIFSLMEKDYGVEPTGEHYACIIDMMSRADKLEEAMEITETMARKPDASIWRPILDACGVHEDFMLTERVAKRLMELDTLSYLPYVYLAWTYEMRGKWESMVRVKKAMKERGVAKMIGCSWIGIRNYIIAFEENQMIHHGGECIYLVLNLVIWETKDEGSIYQHYDKLGLMVEEG